MLQSLKSVRVWRFDLYYFLVFGCFVSFAGWLVTYYTNLYALDLATVGFLASCFSLPSGIIRAFGGWLSDKFGARKLMYWVLGSSLIFSSMLIISKMDIFPSGRGVMAKASGTITDVSTSFVELDSKKYSILNKTDKLKDVDNEFHVFPVKESWQQVVVKKGDIVKKKQLIAEGKTHIFFQANLSIFAIISIIIGSIWGIGKVVVYKHIPDYFPEEVGVVGGMVGVLGGLVGFVCLIIFDYLLEGTGLWSSCWVLRLILSAICLIWMHKAIQKMTDKATPQLVNKFEDIID